MFAWQSSRASSLTDDVAPLQQSHQLPQITKPTARMPLGWERINNTKSVPNKNIVFIKPLKGATKPVAKDYLERIAAQCLPITNNHSLAVVSLEEYEPNLEFWGMSEPEKSKVVIAKRLQDEISTMAKLYSSFSGLLPRECGYPLNSCKWL